jgi:hypothetical protein
LLWVIIEMVIITFYAYYKHTAVITKHF